MKKIIFGLITLFFTGIAFANMCEWTSINGNLPTTPTGKTAQAYWDGTSQGYGHEIACACADVTTGNTTTATIYVGTGPGIDGPWHFGLSTVTFPGKTCAQNGKHLVKMICSSFDAANSCD